MSTESTTQPTTTPFLFVRTKLRPPRLRSDTLPRPRLVETIRQAIGNVRLALVSAPAGYGKTTLVANAVNGLTGVQVVWVTLDSEDNEPLRFLHLLIQALQPIVPTFAAASTTLAAATEESHPRLLGRQIMTAIARGADNAAIATEMIVSIHTVKTHVAHILGKLGVSSRTAAAIKARDLGVIN